ncbi:MAG: hypothetical protein JO024_00900 [Candidatus Eremiobacteraeota bacterium]|nr:hypothetical protein [Candidatus Eremiobacteraeota bacterium]
MRLSYPALKQIGLAALVFCIAATATPTPVPIPPHDAAINATMDFLVGDWNCREIVRGRIRPSRQTYGWTADRHWLVMTEVAPPFDIYRTTTYIMEVRYAFDDKKGKWVELTTDNNGYYGLSYATPWLNGRLVTRDVMNKDNQLTQDVLVRVSDRKTTDTFSGINFKMKPDTITCTKVKSPSSVP